MNKIRDIFNNGQIKIPYIMCGDPNLNVTKEIIYNVYKKAYKMIELGIPFSDPTLESDKIKEQSIRALKQGITTDDIFDFLENIKKDIDILIVFVTYANVVFSYGTDKFFKKCHNIVNGIILLDVPYEEKEEFSLISKKYDVDYISIISSKSLDRIEMITKDALGFIYVVTNSSNSNKVNNINEINNIKHIKNIPCVVEKDNILDDTDISKLIDGLIIYEDF